MAHRLRPATDMNHSRGAFGAIPPGSRGRAQKFRLTLRARRGDGPAVQAQPAGGIRLVLMVHAASRAGSRRGRRMMLDRCTKVAAFGPDRPSAAPGQGPFARLPTAPSSRGLQHDRRAGHATGALLELLRVPMPPIPTSAARRPAGRLVHRTGAPSRRGREGAVQWAVRPEPADGRSGPRADFRRHAEISRVVVGAMRRGPPT